MKKAIHYIQFDWRRHILKMISFFIAVTLWFYVLNSEPWEITKLVRVTYQIPAGMALVGDLKEQKLVDEVKLTLKGPRAFMRSISDSEMKLKIRLSDFSQKKRNQYNVLFSEGDLPIPLGVGIVDVEPNQSIVQVTKEVSKSVEIRANFVGDLKPEHKLVSVKFNPPKMAIVGAKSVLQKIDYVLTEPINKEDLLGKGDRNLSVVIKDSRVKLKENRPVDFSYDVRPLRANIELKQIPVRFLSARRILRSSHKTVLLQVFSTSGDEVDIDKKSIQVIADIPDDKRGRIKVPLRALLPKDIHLLNIVPAEISVTIK